MRAVLAALFALSCYAASINEQFNGRWDIAVKPDVRPRAWWLEISGAGLETLKGRFVGAPGGRLDEVPRLSIFDGELRFSFERRYHPELKELQKGLYWARLEGGKLRGTFEIEGEPASYLEWTGVRAPTLTEKDDGSWKRGDIVNLFDGRDLAGWSPLAPGKPFGWIVREGALANTITGTDLVSDRKFWNFDLHVECRVGPRGDSGIGLRGRYELQIRDDFARPPSKNTNGAIYGRLAPATNPSRPAGEWQTFDIRLIGAQVSVTLNGVRIIDKGMIDGLTAIAGDPNEGEPGPIILQGDHGLIEFRKLVLYPLTKSH
jgi:hypothetical protein